jgi:hypothetical protein
MDRRRQQIEAEQRLIERQERRRALLHRIRNISMEIRQSRVEQEDKKNALLLLSDYMYITRMMYPKPVRGFYAHQYDMVDVSMFPEHIRRMLLEYVTILSHYIRNEEERGQLHVVENRLVPDIQGEINSELQHMRNERNALYSIGEEYYPSALFQGKQAKKRRSTKKRHTKKQRKQSAKRITIVY